MLNPDEEGDAKRRMRNNVRTARRMLPAETAARLSQLACTRLIGSPAFREADRVVAYSGLPGEVDPALIVSQAIAAGREVYLPGRGMEEYAFERVGAREGRARPEVPWLHGRTLFVVPGVAFDAQGWRLGRGGGVYDRLLRPYPEAWPIGLAFEFQIMARVPRHEWDVRMVAVVTEVREIRPDRFSPVPL